MFYEQILVGIWQVELEYLQLENFILSFSLFDHGGNDLSVSQSAENVGGGLTTCPNFVLNLSHVCIRKGCYYGQDN